MMASDRKLIMQLQKAIEDADFIIKRQNEEIRELTEKCDFLDSIIDDKKYEIGRLKYRVNKLQKMVGAENG